VAGGSIKEEEEEFQKAIHYSYIRIRNVYDIVYLGF
jgi:hypothetical protein